MSDRSQIPDVTAPQGTGRDDTPVSETEVRKALANVLGSVQLENSHRLQDFLRYVVDRQLAGASKEIVGKIIAQDVYGRAPSEGSDNIVRVDARRLRRALLEYYGAEGAADPIRIHIDKGHYVPRFERQLSTVAPAAPLADSGEGHPAAPQQTGRSRAQLARVGALLCAGLIAGIWWLRAPAPTPPPIQETYAAEERMALASKSLATLQASNVAAKASELLFPIADVDHQKTATLMFKDAIRIDPDYAGGYAGAAHSLATLAILSPDKAQQQAWLTEAAAMADAAVDLAPTDGWSVSAGAWLAFARDDYDTAKTLAHRAYRLNETDGRVLNYYALIALLTGDFETAQQISDPDTPRRQAGLHEANRNIYGVASFHLGAYDTTIAALDEAIAAGAPVSEFTLLFKAAAHQAKGQSKTARRLMTELSQTWPRFQPDKALRQFYADPDHATQVLNLVAATTRNTP